LSGDHLAAAAIQVQMHAAREPAQREAQRAVVLSHSYPAAPLRIKSSDALKGRRRRMPKIQTGKLPRENAF
jgi:hypothetical protein